MEAENPLKRSREEDQPEETAEEETAPAAPYQPPNDGKFDTTTTDLNTRSVVETFRSDIELDDRDYQSVQN